MAADGSVVIEITGDASEILRAFRQVTTSINVLQDSLQSLTAAFGTVANTAQDIDGGGMTEASNAAGQLDGALDEASGAANRLDDTLDNADGGGLSRATSSADNLEENLNDAAGAAQDLEEELEDVGRASSSIRDVFAGNFLADLSMKGLDAAVAAAQALGGAVVDTAKAALDSYAAFEQLSGGVETLFGNSSATVMQYASNAYKTAGMSANAYMETVTSFAASLIQGVGGDTAEAARLADVAISDMADNANKMGTAMSSIQDAYQGFAKQNYTMLDNLKLGYGGTQEEMIRLINDSGVLEQQISSLDGITFDTIISAIHAIQEEMDITGTTAKEASSTIEGSVNSTKAAWDDLLAGLANEQVDLSGLIENFTTSFSTAFENIVPRVVAIFSGIGPLLAGILPTLISNIPALADAATSIITGLSDGIIAASPILAENAPTIMAALIQALAVSAVAAIEAGVVLVQSILTGIVNSLATLGGAIAEVVGPVMQTAWEQISEAFSNIGQTISDALTSALDAITEWGSNILTSMSDAASGAVEAVSTFFSELPGNVEQFVTDALDRVVTWAGNIISQATEAGSGFITAVGDYLAAVPGDVAAWIEGAIQSVISWGSDMITQAGQKMQEMGETIKNELSSLPGELLTIGGQIVQGLIDGISQKISFVKSKAEELANAIPSRVRQILGIASPSKVLAEIGEYTSQGFGEGIKSGIRYAEEATDELAEETKSHIDDLNAEIEKMEVEAAERQAKAEQEAHEKALAEQYKKLEEAELDKREEIQEKIADLEADWAEKQLKKQEEAQKEALESRIDALEATEKAYEDAMGVIQDALEEFNDEYQDALEDVANSRDSLAGELSDFALYDDFEGEMHLWDLGPMIDQINEYGDVIAELQDRGVNESLLNEILEMDRSEATRFGQELIAMSEDQYEQYMAMWQEKENAAARVAASIYQGEMDAIETEYAEKLPEMMAETADEAMTTLAEHLEGTGQDAVDAIANITDQIIAEIERISAVQTLQAAVQGASMSFGGKLTSNVQNAAEGSAAARRSQTMETAGAVAMATNTNSSREIVLNLNGKEVARGLVPDIRSVEDQSPRIVSD